VASSGPVSLPAYVACTQPRAEFTDRHYHIMTSHYYTIARSVHLRHDASIHEPKYVRAIVMGWPVRYLSSLSDCIPETGWGDNIASGTAMIAQFCGCWCQSVLLSWSLYVNKRQHLALWSPLKFDLLYSIEFLEEPQTTTTKGMENSICHGSSIFNIHYTLIPAWKGSKLCRSGKPIFSSST
jgi:hypothetical protein